MKGQLIQTNSFGYEVYAAVAKNQSSKRMSVKLYTVSPHGEMSGIITIPRKDVIRKKNCFDFFYDLDGDFTRDDIDTIKTAVLNLVYGGSSNVVDLYDKATQEQIYSAISNYIRENAEDLKNNPNADFFINIENNAEYGFMVTSKSYDFIADNKELGVKKLEMLEILNIMDVLRPGKGRVNDRLVRQPSGAERWFYKIELASQPKAVQPDEVIV